MRLSLDKRQQTRAGFCNVDATALAGQRFFKMEKPKCSWIAPCAWSVNDRCFVEAVWNLVGGLIQVIYQSCGRNSPGYDLEALLKSSPRARLSEGWQARLNRSSAAAAQKHKLYNLCALGLTLYAETKQSKSFAIVWVATMHISESVRFVFPVGGAINKVSIFQNHRCAILILLLKTLDALWRRGRWFKCTW